MNARRGIISIVVVGLLCAAGNAAPPAKVALTGARIIPIAGQEIAKGTLLIENGKITALGTDVKIPYDAMEVDVTGKVLFPGMISPHTSEGLDRANESLTVTPYLDVYDALDPSSLSFENALRDGTLVMHIVQGNSCAISALSRVVHPIGRTPDEMTIRPTIALKINVSAYSRLDRMSLRATLREAFLELDDYLGNLAEKRYEDKLKAEKKKVDVPPDEARKRGRALVRDQDCDDKHRNLFRLINGQLDAWFYCGTATDVHAAIDLAKRHGLLKHAVFVLGTDAFRAVDELKRTQRPVVLAAELTDQRRDPITGKLQETFVPRVLFDAGIPFALQPSIGGSLGERYLTYQAAQCVRNGIPRQAALEAITLQPAKMLGIDARLGSLEVGKEAYVLVLTGDPLDFSTWVDKAYIRGVLAYDRAGDVRLQKLMGLSERAAKAQKEAASAKAKPSIKKPATKAEKPQSKTPQSAPPKSNLRGTPVKKKVK